MSREFQKFALTNALYLLFELHLFLFWGEPNVVFISPFPFVCEYIVVTGRQDAPSSFQLFCSKEKAAARTHDRFASRQKEEKKNEIFRVHLGVERKRAVKDAQLLLLGYSSRSAKFLIRLSRHLGRRVQHARRPICLYMLRTRRSSIETRLNL